MSGPFRLGGGLRREHWGAQQPTSAEGGGEAAPALPSCSRQAFAKASRGGEPCLVPAPQNQRLLPGAGRYTDKWIPTFTSFLVLLCFGSQLASHLAFLVLATGCGNSAGQSGLSP